MRLRHVEHRIEQQQALMDFIAHAVDNLTKIGSDNVSPHRARIRLTALNENWEKFSLNHDAIDIAMSHLDETDKQRLRSNSYFSENMFSLTQECFLEAVEKMNSYLSDAQGTSPNAGTTQEVPVVVKNAAGHFRARLPQIDLPKFNGTPSDWLSFKDLFQSLVSSNPALSPVEKLQYLKSSIIGSAAPLLKNTSLTADNFEKAWQSLISFYENKRLLVNEALHSLTTMKRMTKESATEMESLYTTVTQIYRTLETLQRPVETWDDFLVFISVQRLDPESIKAWEHHLGSSKEPPSWAQFSEFLMTRMLSLRAFENAQLGKSTSQARKPAAQSHYAGQANQQSQVSKPTSCTICSQDHYINRCPQYLNKSVQQRLEMVSANKLCYNCLGRHRASACRSTKRCQRCGKKHHTTIHRDQASVARPTPNNESPRPNAGAPVTDPAKQVHCSITKGDSSPSRVLLATAQVTVMSDHGDRAVVRALVDQGSEVSLITERVAQLLHLCRQPSSTPLIGIGAHQTNQTRGLVSVSLKPHFESESAYSMIAHVLPKLTSAIPSVETKADTWPHLSRLRLADPSYKTPGPIDVIIGADIYCQIIENGLIKGPENTPMAQSTKLGWIISGPSGLATTAPAQGYHVSVDNKLHELLQRFWQLEELPPRPGSSLSAEDQDCENQFDSSHSRDQDGRYSVRLPLKHSIDKLGQSRANALKMLSRLTKRFTADPTYHEQYADFLNEYELLKHMKLVPLAESEPEIVYYLPHHGVIQSSSTNPKLRVVFNGSSRTSTGVSLNDILHTGAKLQVDLFDVVIWFRQFRYVFSTDMEKMYRQINVHREDWDLQRILWQKSDGDISSYQLTTVTYGLACAPFLALRTLLQLIKDEGHRFPLAVPILQRGRYVDDIFGGADSVQQAQEMVQQVEQLCLAGGFSLKKWISNHPSVLASIPPEKQVHASSLLIEGDATIQALGLTWKPTPDTFHFVTRLPSHETVTKRSILSTIAQLFDPLGLVSPVIICAKIFMQELWTIKVDWDDPLPDQLSVKWTAFTDQLHELSQISCPRWLGIERDSVSEIHGFSDASQHAIAAVIYIRTTTAQGEVVVSLVCSKTKVAPLKRLTIPRLELAGAVLLTKLAAHIIKVLDAIQSPVFLWTDSSIVSTWINNHPSRWKEYVHNRVCFIQETLPQANWRLVPGTDNPADHATRGVTPGQLSQLSMWWDGPPWLAQAPLTWPAQSLSSASDGNPEERPVKVLTTSAPEAEKVWDLIHRYSSLTRLLRITALCQRFVTRLRGELVAPSGNHITPQELEQAKIYWIKQIQHAVFHHEIQTLSQGKPLPRSNSLIRLTPFLDASGLLRVGGRLQSSTLPSDLKHPLIIPKESPLSMMIISDAHERTLHGGTQATLFFIRQTYWIVGGRAPVRSFILKCVRCTRYRKQRAQQLMGQLPPARVTPSRPFLHSGVDYAGPMMLKTWKGRASRSYKAYIVLFVCQSTAALHIELVTDYTTQAFLAAYKRFTARRGICATLTSDCGTNLMGADAELQRLFSSTSSQLKALASLLANDGTEWKYIPPGAPHFGGQWEAAVKSVKYHLRRVIGEHVLTYEEMSTLLTQIEAVLNSRPICPLTNDPDDITALSPGHFLIGHAPSLVPEPSLADINTSRLSRWQRIRQMVESFWSKWSRECLQRHQAIYKWNQSSTPIEKGSLVLVVDERYPPSKWPLGRIIDTHPGKDGYTRVVTIRTQTSTIKRPIVKVCPLPIETEKQ